jgi:aspartate/glutamate racemase
MHWKPGFEEAWVDRLKKMGITDILIKEDAPSLCGMGNDRDRKSIHRKIYEGLTENDFRRLSREYGIRYVIEDASKQLSFKPVYRNRTFCVYKIS